VPDLTLENYNRALDFFLEACKEKLGDNVRNITLFGSVARGDTISGFSDIDLIVVLKKSTLLRKRKYETILRQLVEDVKKETSVEIGEVNIVHSGSLFKTPKIFLPREGRTLYGEKLVENQPILQDEKEVKKIATKMIDTLFNEWNGKWSNADILTKGKIAAKYCIKNAQNALLLEGIVKLNKKDIAEAFEKKFKIFPHNRLPSKAYQLMLDWNAKQYSESDLASFVNEYHQFIKSLLDYIH